MVFTSPCAGAVIITFLVLKMVEKSPAPVKPTTPTVQLPVYEQPLGNIRFVFESALDKGQVLKASDVVNNLYTASSQKDLTNGALGLLYQLTLLGFKINQVNFGM